MDDQGPREAHTLPHAPPKAHADRPTEAVEADEVDGCEGSPPDLRVAETERFWTFSRTVSHGNSAKLWNTIAIPGPVRRPDDRDS